MNTWEVAFVGNPNVGKSAWINAMSDAQFKVGNWSGVTVEKKEATVQWSTHTIHLIDLPGTYALEDGTSEEAITARYLYHEHVDLIVNVVDATNLSRNLYLTMKLRQLHIPMIVIFNFMDEVQKYDIQIDIDHFQEVLQLNIYPYSAFDQKGSEIVKQAILSHLGKVSNFSPCIPSCDLNAYESNQKMLSRRIPLYMETNEDDIQWLSYGLLYGDQKAIAQCRAWHMEIDRIMRKDKEEDQAIFEWIDEQMIYVHDPLQRLHKTRSIDRFLLHPVWGRFIMLFSFVLLMMFVFQGSAPFNDFIDFLINEMVMKYANAGLAFVPAAARDLILHGVIAGVGGVLVFVPLMAFLHFALSLLEESGYMARIAFLLDPLMQRFHLNGKSFVALLLGFGCNVPAIYATRTLANEKQKKLTALLVPLMSCGARLPVYMLFAAAFFKGKAAVMILCVYGIGILIAFITALICSHINHFHDDSLFVMELPPYRLPSLSVIFRKVKQEVVNYVQKACSVVLWAMVILWGLSYFPNGDVTNGYLAQFAKTAAPLYEPLGFGTRWECVAALPGSVVAKETVVGFMDQMLLHPTAEEIAPIEPMEDLKAIVYELGAAGKGFFTALVPQGLPKSQDDTLVSAISTLWTDKKANLRAFTFMVYLLLSIPCVMTLQALGKEYGWKLMVLSIIMMTLIPYVVSFSIFQLFSLWM